MSEYQYYEFQAIDRPLTDAEQQVVSNLSSRVDPHPRRAVFVYNYGDFRGDEKEILAKYYDAMFYIANWGTTRLLFRFPKNLIDIKQIDPYCVEDRIMCETVGDYIVLELYWNDDDGYVDWIEGEGMLDGLIALRDDILRQDYRVLYLAWLSALYSWEMAEDMLEPPVPPGLQKLTPSLRRFMDAFYVDESLVLATAVSSPAQQTVTPAQLRKKIATLPRNVSDEWLLRLLQGKDAHLSLAFQRFLLADQAAIAPSKGQRTVAEIRELGETATEEAQKQREFEAERQRIQELEAFAPRANASWLLVNQFIQKGNGRSYDEALDLLIKLQQLAIHQNKEAAYATRLRHIRTTYSRKKSMIERLDTASLP